MRKFLIPLVILLGSLLFTWFWNCVRRPHTECASHCCSTQCNDHKVDTTQLVTPSPPVVVDTTKLTTEEKVLFEPLDVYFQSGKYQLARNEKINSWLTLAKKYLEENPNERLSVTGHTDSDGADDANMILSKNRANIVKDILVKDGFSESNLEIIEKGESEPIASNDNAEGKAQNRRVSIRLIK